MSKNWIYSWQWKSSRIRQQFYRSESFAMKTDTLTSGSTVKNHISFNKGVRIQCNTENFVPIVVPGLSTSSSSSFPSSTSITPDRRLIILHLPQARLLHQPQLCQATVRLEHGKIWVGSIPIQHQCPVNMLKSKNGETRFVPTYRSGCKNSEKILWMTEFLKHRDSHASSSHEPSLEPTPPRSADFSKQSIYIHFPKDRNCEICQGTKITRAPCRRRMGGAVPRAENFGDLITADHKVLSEGRDSRNNRRYAIVVVQDLATQWIQSYPCKTKLRRKHKGACKSSRSRIGSLKSFTLTIPWNLAKPVEIFPGIIVRRQRTDRKQMGLLKEQCAE